MEYIEVRFQLDQQFYEIAIAELADIGFESFLEENDVLKAYILEAEFNPVATQEVLNQYKDLFAATFDSEVMQRINWNEEWEKNFDPVYIADNCIIVASFHKIDVSSYEYVIKIDPRMSFGTGHHATTATMMQHLLETDNQDKKVADVGCGTGVLGILSAKMGAESVVACDIDEWCFNNANDNIELNGYPDVQVLLGDVQVIKKQEFDIVIANINKNVLLNDLPTYSELTKKNGILLLSGFYTEDKNDIETTASDVGFRLIAEKTKDNWLALKFQKE